MKKKIVSLVMSIVFIMMCAFPAYAYNGTYTVTKQYVVGYIHLQYEPYFTTSVTKSDSHRWYKVIDRNIETVFVKPNGVTKSGFHYTAVYHGSAMIRSEERVESGKNVGLVISSLYCNVKDICLKFTNGSSNILEGFRARGLFDVIKYDPNF